MRLVAGLEALVVDVERVTVLHAELAGAQQAGAGPGLVAVLRLDLVDDERKVLVAAVQVFHQQREHLFVGGRQQHVGAATVLQAEQVVAVIGPAAGGLVGLLGQQGGEVDLLKAAAVHFFAHDALDVLEHLPAERQPGEATGCSTADVAGPYEQTVAGHLGIGGVLAQGAEEQRRHSQHGGHLGCVRTAYRGRTLPVGRYAARVFEVLGTEGVGPWVHAFLSEREVIMAESAAVQRVRELVMPIVTDLHLDLYDLEFKGGVLRVTIDTPPGSPGGVDLEAIALATRLISRDLDHHDPMPGHYTLEVTSPGLERSLRTPAHFQREIGKVVAIRLRDTTNEERRVHGVLVSADDHGATVRLEEPTAEGVFPERTVAYDQIDRARTVFEWGPTPKKPTPKKPSPTKKKEAP